MTEEQNLRENMKKDLIIILGNLIFLLSSMTYFYSVIPTEVEES